LWSSTKDSIFSVHLNGNLSMVSCSLPDRAKVHSVFEVFERAAPIARLPDPPAPPPPPTPRPVVFIGHGRSQQWRQLKDHLQDKHKIQVEAYEVGARAGHTVRDIIKQMLRNSSFALLVLTAEDEMGDGGKR